MSEAFSPEERAALSVYFSSVDGPVSALVNLPEVTKAALFARHSRSAKPLRRLFLDEFLPDGAAPGPTMVGATRAEELYQRVFLEYGDDSVAQLAGAHLVCEGVSNLLTKALEWSRLMVYLEPSTRFVFYDERTGGGWRYHVPTELPPSLRDRYVAVLDRTFESYTAWLPRMREFYARQFHRPEGVPDHVHGQTLRTKAIDVLRGLLPAATLSTVGIYGTGQGYEQLLLRLRAHPLAEARHCATLMLTELRKVVPALLERVDRPDRGGAWFAYLAETREATRAVAARLLGGAGAEPRRDVTLTDFDPEGEVKVVAAALYSATEFPDDQLLGLVRRMSHADRLAVLQAYVGRRRDRRHRPGLAFERSVYRFDVLAELGAFRDFQRHRLLSLEWQRLSPRHGYAMPEAIVEAGEAGEWQRVMDESAALHDAIAGAGLPDVASYAVAMAYRVRFYMDMNAREAMHVIELRSGPPGQPPYQHFAQAMHRLIGEQAGHRAIAAAMNFADHTDTPRLMLRSISRPE